MNNSKKLLLFAAFFSLFTFLKAQDDKAIVIDFGDEKITKEEFKAIYLKNNSGDVVQKSSVEEYLDLYINFKLKVKEAITRGMDTSQSFQNELSGYRKQLARPYLSEENIINELKKEAYERLKYDVRVSHIMMKVGREAAPEDTIKAYQKAEEVRKLLLKGEQFEEMAKRHSDDQSAKRNNGDLGYFTAFDMVYPFETAAYKTEVGGISEIVRSRFGYHILKVMDKRPAIGTLTVAHILISTDPQLSKTDDPEGKIKEIYQKLKQGESFEELARQFSDDSRSSSKGGVMKEFGVGKMVPEIEAEAVRLKNKGDYSEPFQTSYGWHIIKKINQESIKSYKEMDYFLDEKVKKDSRSRLSEGAVIQKIKKQYGFKEKIKNRDEFYTALDSGYFKNSWNSSHLKKYNKELFIIGEKKVTQADFVKYLEDTHSKRRVIDKRILVNNKYRAFRKKQLLDYKDARLDREYPEFKALMQEYHDGILLFNLTDELIWSKASKDTTGLMEFYEKGKEDYKWKERLDAIYFSTLNKQIAAKVKEMIKDSVELSQMIAEINRPSQLNVKYEQGLYEKGDFEMVDRIEWKEGISEEMEDEGRIAFVYVRRILPPNYKTIEDSKGTITSDYQDYLEKEWIDSLRNKYTYKVEHSILKELEKELN